LPLGDPDERGLAGLALVLEPRLARDHRNRMPTMSAIAVS
jgi:hypothetical protein